MPNYQNSKIYKIYSVSNEELVYYGSTTKTLTSRLANHIYDYNNNKNYNLSCKSIFDAGDYKIELVEEYPCVNKQQLVKKEGEYIKNNVCVNKVIPDRTLKEWYEDNKEHIKKIHKDYRENNKEFVSQINKEYREKNKNNILEKAKEYRKKNKQFLNQKVTCECGCNMNKFNLKRHQETPKHIKLMEEKNHLENN